MKRSRNKSVIYILEKIVALIRILIQTIALILISFFLFSNIDVYDRGNGYVYLICFMFISLLLQLMSNLNVKHYKIKISTIILFFFLSYFFMSVLIDIDDIELIKAYTVGTTGGVFFGLYMGFYVSVVISDMYLMMKRASGGYLFVSLCITIFMIFSFLILTFIFEKYYFNVRDDLFLIVDKGVKYQRIGNYIFIHFMIVSTLLFLINLLKKSFLSVIFLINILFYLLIASISIAISQITGSNSGFVCITIFCVATFATMAISNKSQFLNHQLDRNAKILLYVKLIKHSFVKLLKYFVTLSTCFLVLIYIFSIDINKFRIFGFGQGYLRSLNTRIFLIKRYFIDQWSYNPLFGNSMVDKLTTGTGSYAHSLPLSLLSHLGFVGFCLFVIYLIQIYIELSHLHNLSIGFYSNKRISLFRLIMFGIVLSISTITAFYTWLPLWFAVGMFGVSRCISYPMIEKRIA